MNIKSLTATSLDDGSAIVLFVTIFLLAIGVVALFYFLTKRDRNKSLEKLGDKSVVTLDWLIGFLRKKISAARKGTAFYLFEIELNDAETMLKVLGEVQYQSLLKDIADGLTKLLPYSIKVGRKGEHGFIIYVKNPNVTDIQGFSQLILETVSNNSELSKAYGIEISCNVAAVSFPIGGKEPEMLIKNLDLAMAVSRRKGDNKIAFWTVQMSKEETSEYKYYQEIKDAMKVKEFTLFYQPIIEEKTKDVIGAESLIRWKHKTLGILPPSDFLYVMEQTGDIFWVGNWCFDQMTKQVANWFNNHENRFVVGINLSERQLINAELADDFFKTVRKNKVSANNFAMEVSNFNLYLTSEVAKDNIDKLHELGFKIVLDNFGAEYNTVTGLEELPVDMIKIDQKFWKKSRDNSVFRYLIEIVVKLCASKNILLVAQGVESEEEIEYLKELGIKHLQGYYFAKPKDPRDFISDVLLTPWNSNGIATLPKAPDR